MTTGAATQTANEIWRNDAIALAGCLDRRELTPSALLGLYLDRIDRLNPKLNAFTIIDRDGAMSAAREADSRQEAGKRLGPLDGLPVCIKDNLYVRGLPAAWGSLMIEDFVPEHDDICVERLRAAGAVIMGKTTTPEFALLGRTENRVTGTTRNPWDPALHPGGSSGGAAAAVAAGLVPLALGTDAGGSSRLPASYTGLVGIRPSNGRIPRRYGFLPMALDFQAIGLITRTTRDLKMLFAALSGPDWRDPMSLLAAPNRRRAPPPLKLGWFTSIGNERASREVTTSHANAIEMLKALGHQIEQCKPPFDIDEIRGLWDTLTAVGATRAALKYGDKWKTLATPQIVGLIERGQKIAATDYVYALDRLQLFRAETSAHWGDYDALILPTNPVPAWLVETEQPMEVDGQKLSPASQGMFCGWVNAMGYAGLSVPGEPAANGLPIGIQIVAPAGGDEVVMEIAQQLEDAAPWRDRWPVMASLR